MLAFRRKKGEEFVIGSPGSEIRVMVLDIRKDGARIGVTADRSVPVHRREVYDQIHGTTEPPPQSDSAAA